MRKALNERLMVKPIRPNKLLRCRITRLVSTLRTRKEPACFSKCSLLSPLGGDISLTKIESRPNHNCPIRLVDDANVGSILSTCFTSTSRSRWQRRVLRTRLPRFKSLHRSFLRVLGSYPMDMTPWSPSRRFGDNHSL